MREGICISSVEEKPSGMQWSILKIIGSEDAALRDTTEITCDLGSEEDSYLRVR
jgi:hypothetical protein